MTRQKIVIFFVMVFVLGVDSLSTAVFAKMLTETQKQKSMKEQIIDEYRAQGYEAQQKGDINKALEYYTKAMSLGLDEAALLNDMGVLYEQVGLVQKAEQFYVDALQRDNSYLPPYLNLAYLYLKKGQTDLAAELFQQRYELGTTNDQWREKAKEELIKLRPEYAQRFIEAEAVELQNQLVQEAREVFYAKVDASKRYYNQGMTHYQAGEFQKAIEEYDKALRLMPNHHKTVEARKQAVIAIAKKNIQDRSNQAIQLLDQGDAASAKNEIEKALTTIP